MVKSVLAGGHTPTYPEKKCNIKHIPMNILHTHTHTPLNSYKGAQRDRVWLLYPDSFSHIMSLTVRVVVVILLSNM